MKIISSAFFTLCFFFIINSIYAQRTIKIGDLNKSFSTKPHFIDLPSWNTLGEKDTYIPLFIETYYTIEKDMLVQYDFWFSNGKKYNAKNTGTASYKESDLSNVYVTKYPISIFAKKDENGEPLNIEIDKENNEDWKEFFTKKMKDMGAFNLLKNYKKPYFKVFYYLQKDKKYTVEQYDVKANMKAETETRESNDYRHSFDFHNKAEAENFAQQLKAALK